MVVVSNLVKKYGKLLAVNDLSLEIEKGQIYGFVGANGAGKTTTMRIISGLLRATSGKVLVNGIDISKNPRAVKKMIGYMPDFFGVYSDLKVSEYMNFYSGLYGIPPRNRKKIIDDLLELVNLSDKRDAYVDSLSRGMKQRLCLARSLIHDPDLLILDEPASGLDPRARVEMKEILKELKSMGRTIIISSHILHELSEICTAIGIIDNGKMVVSGPVEEIMAKLSHSRRIKVKVLKGGVEPLEKCLQEEPEIGRITTGNDYVEADFNGNGEKLAGILKNIVIKGVPVISFTETGENLESIFMHVTRGNSQDADKSNN